MRSEEETYGLIMDIAKADERILAVYMNGSRTNPNVPKDLFQDYDIVYVVKETKHLSRTRTGFTNSAKSCICSILMNTRIQITGKAIMPG